MTDKIVYKVSDMHPAVTTNIYFIIEILDDEQNPIKNVEFSYSIDGNESTMIGKTDEHGILNVRQKPDNEIRLFLVDYETDPTMQETTLPDEEINDSMKTGETEITTDTFDTTQLLKNGSGGDKVKLLQEKLNIFGAKLEVDGLFGPLTDKVVRLFQKANDLEIDGIVGPITWGALDSYKLSDRMKNYLLQNKNTYDSNKWSYAPQNNTDLYKKNWIPDNTDNWTRYDWKLWYLCYCAVVPDSWLIFALHNFIEENPEFILNMGKKGRMYYGESEIWCKPDYLKMAGLFFYLHEWLKINGEDRDDLKRMNKRVEALFQFFRDLVFGYNTNSDDLNKKRVAIVFVALSQIGRLSAKTSVAKDIETRGNARYGWMNENRYFATAYGCRPTPYKDEFEPIKDSTSNVANKNCSYNQNLKNGVHDIDYKGPHGGMPQHWCGIFCLWVLKRCGVCGPDIKWELGRGFLLNSGKFDPVNLPELPKPGDIGFQLKERIRGDGTKYYLSHHDIVIKVVNGIVDFNTVDGNSYNNDFKCGSGVWLNNRNNSTLPKNDKFVFYKLKGIDD